MLWVMVMVTVTAIVMVKMKCSGCASAGSVQGKDAGEK